PPVHPAAPRGPPRRPARPPQRPSERLAARRFAGLSPRRSPAAAPFARAAAPGAADAFTNRAAPTARPPPPDRPPFTPHARAQPEGGGGSFALSIARGANRLPVTAAPVSGEPARGRQGEAYAATRQSRLLLPRAPPRTHITLGKVVGPRL